MDVGIGLPATVPGVDGKTLVEWARRSDEAGFSTLGTIDRLVYPSYEPLAALAAAAAVTQRTRLTTSILIAPLRVNAALLAKQAATLDDLSGGRLTLGVAIGQREDDYEASGIETGSRGAMLDSQLQELKRVWSGEERGIAGPIGPPARNGGPELIVGGTVEASFDRAARHAKGWMMGGGAPDQFRDMAQKVREAWSRASRDESPRLISLAYFVLGEGAREAADSYIHDYYEYLGDVADAIAQSVAVDEGMVAQYLEAFSAAGCDELILFPCSTRLDQVDLLARAAL